MLWMLWKDRHIYKRMDVAGNCSLLGGVVYGLTICFAPFILLYFLSSSLSLFSWISFGAISPGLLGYGCLFDSSQGASLSIALLHFSSFLSVSFDAVARVVYSCLQSGLIYVWCQLRWNGLRFCAGVAFLCLKFVPVSRFSRTYIADTNTFWNVPKSTTVLYGLLCNWVGFRGSLLRDITID